MNVFERTTPTRKKLCYMLPVWVIVIIFPFLIHNCTPLIQTSTMYRQIHVKVVADSTFMGTSRWENNVHNLFENASRVYESWFDITFIIDTIVTWDMSEASCITEYFAYDCLMKEVPKGKSDIVVYLSKEDHGKSFYAGLSLIENGYILVHHDSRRHRKGTYEEAFHVLIHELGHMFGGIHLYYDKNKPYIMNAYLHDNLLTRKGFEYHYSEPDFHPGNVTIIQAMRSRPFTDSGWIGYDWEQLQTTYQAVRNKYNPWTISRSKMIQGHAFNHFHEGDMFAFLSSWASLAGKHALALQYIDSLELLMESIASKCIAEGNAGNEKICRRCRTDKYHASEWLEFKKATLANRKALIYLKEGNATKADSCFQKFLSTMPASLLSIKMKYLNSFNFYKTLFDTGSRIVDTTKP